VQQVEESNGAMRIVAQTEREMGEEPSTEATS
jgi:hypothetical protein